MPPSVNGQLPADCAPMLDSLWQQAVATESQPARDACVADAARQLCDSCRAAGLRVEHVVLALKEHCRANESSVRDERRTAEQTLASVISLCIREYYQTNPGDGAPAAGGAA